MLVLKVLVGLHRTVPLLLFHVAGWSIGLDYRHIEWFALEMNGDHLSFLRLHPSTAFQTLLLTMVATPFLLKVLANSSRYNGHLS